MSTLAKCQECDGKGGDCAWCEGWGVIQVEDGYRSRLKRPKGWLDGAVKRGEVAPPGHDFMAAKADRPSGATVIECPPARASLRVEK